MVWDSGVAGQVTSETEIPRSTTCADRSLSLQSRYDPLVSGSDSRWLLVLIRSVSRGFDFEGWVFLGLEEMDGEAPGLRGFTGHILVDLHKTPLQADHDLPHFQDCPLPHSSSKGPSTATESPRHP